MPLSVPDAEEYGFASAPLEGGGLVFAALLKAPTTPVDSLIVYIEGDGRVVEFSGQISANPTPRRPISWKLARRDPAPAVLYLPRLGQYSEAYAAADYRQYWTGKRFAPEIVRAMSLALDKAKARAHARQLHLIGFSGGGAVAALLAASRDDVASLATVAGLLNHAFWTAKHNYKPLVGSLNPSDTAHSLRHIPQIHFYGKQNTIISPEISEHFLRLGAFANAQRVGVVAGHNDGWENAWPGLLTDFLVPLRLGTTVASPHTPSREIDFPRPHQ